MVKQISILYNVLYEYIKVLTKFFITKLIYLIYILLYRYFYGKISFSMKNSVLVFIVFISNFILSALGFSLSVGAWHFLMYGAVKGIFIYVFLHTLYLILPLACIFAIFAVYIFMMRHPQNRGMSFLVLIITFAIFFSLLIPLVYSQGEKIDRSFNAQEKVLIEDEHLRLFIEPPFFIETTIKLLKPFLSDIYLQYRNSYIYYLIFAGSIFFLMFSFWGFTEFTKWKIVNFSLFPFLFVVFLYVYSYIRTDEFILNLKEAIPLEIPNFWISPILFFCGAVFFYAHTAILFFIRKAKNTPKNVKGSRKNKLENSKNKKTHKIKAPKIKLPKPVKPKKNKKEISENSTFIPESLGDFYEEAPDA